MSMKDIRKQFADTMLDVGCVDSKLVVMVGDISHFNLQPFAQACPGRYFNIGILEPTMISLAAGLAKVGLLPVAHTIAPFILERSLEQLKLDFGYQGLPGNIVTVGSAFDYSNLGCSHHCYADFALFRTIPNTQITFPASPLEFDLLFKQAYANSFLTLYRIPSHSHGIEFDPVQIQLGNGIKLLEGSQLTVVVTGPELGAVLQACSRLSEFQIEVLYFHTIRPFDRDLLLESVGKTRRVLVIEEHQRSGGLGMEVLDSIQGMPDIQFAWRGLPERFLREYGSYEDHCKALGLDTDGLEAAIRVLLS